MDHGPAKLRVEYDPRDLSAVFVELPSGDHVRVPYAEMGRLPITRWELREATRRLRAEGARLVDEHAIFRAVEEQRLALLEAQSKSRAARRAVRTPRSRERSDAIARAQKPGGGQGGRDTEAKVPMPLEGETSGVEFW